MTNTKNATYKVFTLATGKVTYKNNYTHAVEVATAGLDEYTFGAATVAGAFVVAPVISGGELIATITIRR